MRLLTFQAERFAWKSFSKTLDEVPDVPEGGVDESVNDAVVVYLHIEAEDEPEERRKKVFLKTLKHTKWIANKRDMKNVVLHSFTHLGGSSADADFAKAFLDELQTRLEGTGYRVWQTPFGYFCSWDLAVYGESLAKVYKAL